MIGLSIRAGKTSFGTDAVKNAIRKKKAKLVLLSDTASQRSAKDLNDICSYYSVEILSGPFADIFYQLTAKEAMKVISINDEQFAREIKNLSLELDKEIF